jgi:hypothetical protein
LGGTGLRPLQPRRHRGPLRRPRLRQSAPFTIGRHSRPKARPKARPEQPGRPAPPAAGINYLNLIGTAHASELEQRINYAALLGGSHDPDPGQMTLDEALHDAPQEES